MLNLNLGSLVTHILADTSRYTRALRGAEATLDRFARRATAIGRRMTYAISLPLAALGGLAVKLASDAEEIDQKFTVTFGNIQSEAVAAMNELDKSYGLNVTEAKNLLAGTGDLLTGFGFAQQAALDLSLQVQRLAVDLASFQNLQGGAKRASDSLTKALLGERESAKLLGIVIREEDVKSRMLENRRKGLIYATENQAKAYATLQIAQEQSKNAMGDYARTSESFANQFREMISDLKDLGEDFGRVLLPYAREFIAKIKEIVAWFKALSPETKATIVRMAALAIALPPIIWGLGMIAGGLKSIIGLFLTLGLKGLLYIGIIAGAVALLVDLFTDGKLGFIEFIGSIRVGSHKVSTWFGLTATYIVQTWNWATKVMIQAWWWWRDVALDAGAAVGRGMIHAAQGIARAFWWAIEKVLDAFIYLSKSLLDLQHTAGLLDFAEVVESKVALDLMAIRLKRYAQTVDEVYNKQIAGSLGQAQKREEEYYAAIAKANVDYTKNVIHWNAVRDKMIRADKADAAKSAKTNVAKALASLGVAAQPGVPGAVGAGARGGYGAAGGEFKEVSLRRISLQQPAPTRTKKQEVHDETVAQKLDQIYQTLADRKAATAILG